MRISLTAWLGSLSGWSAEQASYVTWTVIWAAAFPFLLYVLVVGLFVKNAGLKQFLGSGNLWLMAIGITAGTLVELFRIDARTEVDKKVFHLFVCLGMMTLVFAILPWTKATVTGLSNTSSLSNGSLFLSLSGAPATLGATAFGWYAIGACRK